jgi:aryl-alcohol dehydrogenase-like predicted oxidoreductase
MEYVKLGRTGERVSRISLGTWSYGGSNTLNEDNPIGWSGQDDKDSTKALMKAYESGINHWDTADVYGDGHSEKIIGSVWAELPRNKIFLATKVGWDMGPYNHWYHPKHMRTNMERSLKNLKTDNVDLMYLHHCNFGKNKEYFDSALEVVNRFKEEGKTKFIGLSDWSLKKIMEFIKPCNPDVIQPYRNVMDDTYSETGLKDFIDSNDLGVCFFSPIKHGLLTGKYSEPTVFEAGDFRTRIKDFVDQDIIDQMKLNKSKLESKFSDHLESVMHGLVDALLTDSPTGCVLLGQRNTKQVESATSLGFALSEEEASWVKNLYQ